MEASSYYISPEGKLCITFPNQNFNRNLGILQDELCEVIGCQNETWFVHKEIKTK